MPSLVDFGVSNSSLTTVLGSGEISQEPENVSDSQDVIEIETTGQLTVYYRIELAHQPDYSLAKARSAVSPISGASMKASSNKTYSNLYDLCICRYQ